MNRISGSVGRRGVNSRNDVVAVQTFLNNALRKTPSFRPLVVDGLIGPRTIAAIELFQRDVLRWSHADGRVDPAGRTLAALSRNQSSCAAPPIVPPPPIGGDKEATPVLSGSQQKPNWITFAEAEKGIAEIEGPTHSPRVLEYFTTTSWNPQNDETAWCSAFVNWVMIKAGYAGTNSAQATSWADWGKKLDEPAYGSIGVIDWDGSGPGWQGHVGFVVGKNGNFVQMLGGNQGDSVKVSGYNKTKFIAFVVPSNYTVPKEAYQLGSDGQVATGSYKDTR